MKRVCGFAVSYISYALLRRVAVLPKYVHAAYVTDRVAWSVGRPVGLSVCHTSEPCKNGRSDRDAVWVEDLGNHVLRGGPDPPMERGNSGGLGCPL